MISFDFLKTDDGKRAVPFWIWRVRKITDQPALKPYEVEEPQPGPATRSDEVSSSSRARGYSASISCTLRTQLSRRL
jgi:hypothetical protein